jgi:hypothetical protein
MFSIQKSRFFPMPDFLIENKKKMKSSWIS